ncbi:MAG: hypothetical protein SVV03_00235 [Candidatus Nanohaloarchaea archaeon]|nr:hypothetical protein [Candidatus Nanohaloarchaea archaeon]
MSMKYVWIALILLLIPLYVMGVYALPSQVNSTCDGNSGKAKAAAGEKVGFCTEISVSVMRPYYFDTIRLPVYRAGMNLDWAHRLFPPALLAAAALIWWRYD